MYININMCNCALHKIDNVINQMKVIKSRCPVQSRFDPDSTLGMVTVIVAILGILLTLTTSVKGCPGQIMGPCFPIPSPSMGCGGRRRVRRSSFVVIDFLRILLQFYSAQAPNWYPYSGPVDSGPLDYGLNPGQNFMRAQGGCIHSCGWGKKK